MTSRRPSPSRGTARSWGLRNPYGIAFVPDGRLCATEHGIDERNARHVIGDHEDFYEIIEGAWYGWPDFASGVRLDDPYWGDGGRGREPVLAEHPDPNPPKPFVTFDQHSGPNGVDFCRDPDFGFPGHAFVALFGDLTPVTTRLTTPSGFKVVRVDINTGEVSDFAVNKVQGPASKLPHRGFERPSHCQFGPDGALYVVDFGQISIAPEKGGIRVQKGTGAMAHPSYGRPSRATPIRAVVVRPPTPSKRRPGQPPLSSRGSSCVGCSKGRTGMMPRSGPSSRRRRHLLNLTERKDET